MGDFLKQKGSYKNLIVYKKTECIYDVTYYFAHHFLSRGDRTIDQMVQAARSGKQNIAEGRSNGNTSAEMEIKLMNVAKGSLMELLEDYEDYLRVRNMEIWSPKNIRFQKMRELCVSTSDSAYFSNLVTRLKDYEIANLAICMIHQADAMLYKLIELIKSDFLKNGGAKEQMYQARIQSRSSKGKGQ